MSSERILAAATWSTVVLAVSATAAVLWPDTLALPYAVVGVVAFLAGCVTFVWGYTVAAGRSRTEVLSVVGISFLADAAPSGVRWRLLGALVAQCVIVVVAASIRPFTAVAFGVLAPMIGLGLTSLWGARYGTYPERDDHGGRRRGP